MNQTERICLRVDDFATDAICAGGAPLPLSISFERLAHHLALAKRMQQAREPGTGVQSIKSGRQTRKRKLPYSSPERLRSEDEEYYRSQESRSAKRTAVEDGDFRSRARRP